MGETCEREHKIGEMHTVTRMITSREQMINTPYQLALLRNAFYDMAKHQIDEEAARCGLVMGPLRYHEHVHNGMDMIRVSSVIVALASSHARADAVSRAP